MMSSDATSSPVSASTFAYLMRWPVLRLIWLKETFSVSEVAGYSATGRVPGAQQGNQKRPPRRRDDDRSPAGRTRALGAGHADRLHWPCDCQPACALVRVFPH